MRRELDLSGPWATAAAPIIPDEVYALMDSNMAMERRARPLYGSLSSALLDNTNVRPCVTPSVIHELLSRTQIEDVYYAQLDRLLAWNPCVLPDANETFHSMTGGSYSSITADGEVAFLDGLARPEADFDLYDASLLAAGNVYGLPVITDNWRMLNQRRGHPLRDPAFRGVEIVPIGTSESMRPLERVASDLGSVSSFHCLGRTLPPAFDPDFHSRTIASLTNVSTNRSALFGGARAAGGAGASTAAIGTTVCVVTTMSHG